MRFAVNYAVGVLLFCSLPTVSRSESPRGLQTQADSSSKSSSEAPTDVPSDHWAGAAVRAVIKNGVLSNGADHKFHGDDPVSQTDAAIAIFKVAHALVEGAWQKSPSSAITSKTIPVVRGSSWQNQPVTRYICAKVLAQSADYLANGLSRPPAGAMDLGKSDILPKKVNVTIARTNPAYDALTYLAAHRMLSPKSPILTPEQRPIRGAELALAVHDMLLGAADALTPLGHDANGSTRDDAFHPKKP